MSTTQKHIALICNPAADSSKTLLLADSIARLLEGRGVAFQIFTTYWPQVWSNFTEAWIVGGDGTVNYFINQYPELKLPLALFGGGTANDLHHLLYSDMAVEAQVAKMLVAEPQAIDGGICNGKLFLNGIGIGFDGAIVQDLQGKRKRPGKATYLLSVLKHIFRYNETWLDLQWPGGQLAQPCFMVSVANGRRYGGGFTVTPKADVQDGLLDVMVVGKIAAASRIKYLPVIEKGEHVAFPFVRYGHTDNIIIQAQKPLPAHRDGELFVADRFEIKCLPHHFSLLL